MIADSLEEQYKVVEMTALLVRLRALDDLWTENLQRTERISDQDKKVLETVAARMSELLTECEDYGQRMSDVIRRNPDAVEAGQALIYSASNLSEEQKAQWRKRVDRFGGMVPLFTQVAEGLAREATNERRLLAEKIQVLESGRPPSGDLTDEYQCWLDLGIAWGGLCIGGPFFLVYGLTRAHYECP
jgi:hypothetical protein